MDAHKVMKVPGRRPVVILLVEDNADHAALVMRNLSNHPLANRIYHVPDGESALDFLHRRGDYADAQRSPRPDLILLDLRLPRMDGLDVLRQVKNDEGLREIPVAILTTSDAEKDVAQAFECRANSYLVKPVDFTNFTRLMDELSYEWLARDQHPWS
jgi:CheY-like chemotaxis protein